MRDRLCCILFYKSVGIVWVEVVEDHCGLEELIQHPLWKTREIMKMGVQT